MDDPVSVLRMLERILAVLIGGFSIYLGYRLFFHLPTQHDHTGEMTLPGVKIVLSRVGPGVFFAAFGCAVLFYSLTNPVTVRQNNGSAGTSESISKEFVGVTALASAQASPQQIARVATTIEVLNCIGRLAAASTTDQMLIDSYAVALDQARRSLLLSVWDASQWGTVGDGFDLAPLSELPIALRGIANAMYPDCPS